jgi:transcriptional regulator with XRE-family HTH domain
MPRHERTVGSRLRELREGLNLTQQEFAKRFGVPARTSQSYERDEVAPSAAFLKKLADQNIDINELLTGRPYRHEAKGSAGYTAIVATDSEALHLPGELDLEVLETVLRDAIEEARSAKHIHWARTVQRFAMMYARRFGELHPKK